MNRDYFFVENILDLILDKDLDVNIRIFILVCIAKLCLENERRLLNVK